MKQETKDTIEKLIKEFVEKKKKTSYSELVEDISIVADIGSGISHFLLELKAKYDFDIIDIDKDGDKVIKGHRLTVFLELVNKASISTFPAFIRNRCICLDIREETSLNYDYKDITVEAYDVLRFSDDTGKETIVLESLGCGCCSSYEDITNKEQIKEVLAEWIKKEEQKIVELKQKLKELK
jgi:hypothetical protein